MKRLIQQIIFMLWLFILPFSVFAHENSDYYESTEISGADPLNSGRHFN